MDYGLDMNLVSNPSGPLYPSIHLYYNHASVVGTQNSVWTCATHNGLCCDYLQDYTIILHVI